MAHPQWYYNIASSSILQAHPFILQAQRINMELNLNNVWMRELQLERTIFSSKTTCTMIMHLEQVILSNTVASATKILVVIVHAPCDIIILQLWWISKVVIATSLKLKIKVCDLVASYKIENTNIMINKRIN
jgi:hypothetical protein